MSSGSEVRLLPFNLKSVRLSPRGSKTSSGNEIRPLSVSRSFVNAPSPLNASTSIVCKFGFSSKYRVSNPVAALNMLAGSVDNSFLISHRPVRLLKSSNTPLGK